MSEAPQFHSQEEQLREFQKEIQETREVLKEIGRKLNAIEARVKRALPRPVSEKGASAPRKPAKALPPPSISPEQALKVFDEMSAMLRSGNGKEVESRLEQLPFPDLLLVAHEIGLTFRSKPGRGVVTQGVIGRLNESMMLSRNINSTPPRSAAGGES